MKFSTWGGGHDVSTSLLELTRVCQEVKGNEIQINQDPTTTPVDVPYYVSNSEKFSSKFDWKPKVTVHEIVRDIHQWLKANHEQLSPIFG